MCEIVKPLESAGGWELYHSRRSPGRDFYFNPVSKQSVWETPSGFLLAINQEKVFEEELEKRLQLAAHNSRLNKPYRAVPANHPEETGATSSTTPRVRSPKRLADRSLSAPDAKRLKVTVEF